MLKTRFMIYGLIGLIAIMLSFGLPSAVEPHTVVVAPSSTLCPGDTVTVNVEVVTDSQYTYQAALIQLSIHKDLEVSNIQNTGAPTGDPLEKIEYGGGSDPDLAGKVIHSFIPTITKKFSFDVTVAAGVTPSKTSYTIKKGTLGQIQYAEGPVPPELDAQDIVIACNPVADAGLDQVVFVGQIVTFDGSGSYDPTGLEIVDYTWDVGEGGKTVSGQTATYTYNSDDSLDVTLTVTNSGGKTGTDTAMITVLPPPEITRTLSKPRLEAGSPITVILTAVPDSRKTMSGFEVMEEIPSGLFVTEAEGPIDCDDTTNICTFSTTTGTQYVYKLDATTEATSGGVSVRGTGTISYDDSSSDAVTLKRSKIDIIVRVMTSMTNVMTDTQMVIDGQTSDVSKVDITAGSVSIDTTTDLKENDSLSIEVGGGATLELTLGDVTQTADGVDAEVTGILLNNPGIDTDFSDVNTEVGKVSLDIDVSFNNDFTPTDVSLEITPFSTLENAINDSLDKDKDVATVGDTNQKVADSITRVFSLGAGLDADAAQERTAMTFAATLGGADNEDVDGLPITLTVGREWYDAQAKGNEGNVKLLKIEPETGDVLGNFSVTVVEITATEVTLSMEAKGFSFFMLVAKPPSNVCGDANDDWAIATSELLNIVGLWDPVDPGEGEFSTQCLLDAVATWDPLI